MLWIVALLLSLAAGWLLAGAAVSSSRMVRAGLAIMFGPAVSSLMYWMLVAVGLVNAGVVIGALAALTALSYVVARRFPLEAKVEPGDEGTFPYTWAVAVAAGLACIFFLLNFFSSVEANPHGEWDAAAIYNLRAKLLTQPDTWRRAISAEPGSYVLTSSHPGYPLFLSSFVAMLWSADGSFTQAAPQAVSLLMCVGLLMLLAGSLWSRRAAALALLAAVILLSTDTFSLQASAQYSDVALGVAFLAALVLMYEAWSRQSGAVWCFAGLALGFAPWIKNEGWPFALAGLAAAAMIAGRSVVWVAAGAAPGLLATMILKLLSEGRESMTPASFGQAMNSLMSSGRWADTLMGLGKMLVDVGPLWAHPILLAAVVTAVLKLQPRENLRLLLWLGVPVWMTMAVEFGVYLVAQTDLNWHIPTSAPRLFLQLWGCVLWLIFMAVRSPEVRMPIVAAEPVKKKKRK